MTTQSFNVCFWMLGGRIQNSSNRNTYILLEVLFYLLSITVTVVYVVVYHLRYNCLFR